VVIFFFFEKTLRVMQNEFGFSYEHKFEKIPEQKPNADKQIPFETIYFSTPSDFHNHMENIKTQIGEEAGVVQIVDPPKVVEHPQFPVHIGFQNLEEALAPFKGRKSFNLAILNAMSNAIGDHLIGMQAFDYFQEQVQALLPETEVDISFYQLNPYRVAPITRGWKGKWNHIYMLPNRLSRFMQHDAFIDLGTLLLRDNFGCQPMVDFFFEAISIDPKTVPDERKRIKFEPTTESLLPIQRIFNTIKSSGRPVLMFHHTSTSPLRQMSIPRARDFVSKIIKNTDYFVISADSLEYQNSRFMDLSKYSQTTDDFASIISQADALISVDTATYHIADAFSIPTVVLFTSIEPEYRIKYYPFTEGIMLEKEGGMLYGKHKASKEEDKMQEEVEYTEKIWDTLKVEDVLESLERMKTKKKESL